MRAAIEIWAVCTLIAVYIRSRRRLGFRDMVTVDAERYFSSSGGLVFRAPVSPGIALSREGPSLRRGSLVDLDRAIDTFEMHH